MCCCYHCHCKCMAFPRCDLLLRYACLYIPDLYAVSLHPSLSLIYLELNPCQENCFRFMNILDVSIAAVDYFQFTLVTKCYGESTTVTNSQEQSPDTDAKTRLLQESFDVGRNQRSRMNNHRCWSNNRMIDWPRAPHCLR